MKSLVNIGLLIVLAVIVLTPGCEEDAPPRNEIPVIKAFLGEFTQAVNDKNAARIDSMIIADAYEMGYHSTRILNDVYQDDTAFFAFGKKEFFYTKNKASVQCQIMADSTDPGRPAEITLIKKHKKWYIKRFDLL